eukprot:NODE_1261_length_931_cov_108.514925_g1215_i0.p1 GENE.NODE_1261_length_931_cov_108.514925_g1215_i0~~NODE_1261_length_931_cov_108.514925_g1215_i0.p1  ORF type:complete len:186 (-),score=37.46 NODE_1261_length_931_cov_108.514925_g1215_i0:61-618(-)
MGKAAPHHTVVVVGAGGVGKSCLTVRFLKDEFMAEYDPTIEENYRKKVVTDGYECLLDIVDTAGQQEYTSLRDQHLRTGQGFLICFAINDEASFHEMKELHQSIIRVKEGEGESNVPFVIIGNKVDLADTRTVSAADAKAFAESISSPYFETSAKTNINVVEAFHASVSEIRKRGQKKKGGCVVL